MHDDSQTTDRSFDQDNQATGNAAQPTTPESGDVLSLIADVEKHLDRIRNVQSRQETEYADLAERQRRVVASEGEVAARREELDELAARLGQVQASTDAAKAAVARERDDLESCRAQVRAEQGDLDAVRGELDGVRAELDRRSVDLDGRAEALSEETESVRRRAEELERVEHELTARIEQAEAARTEAAASLEEAGRQLAERDAELEALRAEIAGKIAEFEASAADRDRTIGELRSDSERRDAELAEAHEGVQRYRQALEEVGGELERTQGETESIRGELDAAVARADSAEAAGREAEEARAELIETVERLDTRCRELEDELTARQSSFEALQAGVAEAESTISARDERIAELEARTEEDQRQLRLAGSKLAELAQVVAEQAPRLERGTEAMAIVAELEAEIERLRSEAAAAQGLDAAAIRAPLEGRIEELETELEHARSQVADQASVEEAVSQATAPFQIRIAELEATLEAARGAEGIDADALAEAVAEARIPLEDRIRELEAAASQGDPAAIDAAVEAATSTLRAELEQARADAAGGDVPRTKYENLKEKCRRAERRSDELETALSLTNDRGQAQEMAKRLRGKAERISEFSRHLERRKARLGALRTAMRQRAALAGSTTETGGGTFHELQRLEAQRRELEQVRDFLSRSEQQMVRRWARPRSVGTVAWVMLILAVSAAAGWFGTTRFLPVPGVASVTLDAATTGGDALSPEAAEAWETWHAALATDPAFIDLVSKRLAARGLAPEGGESAVASMLADDLVFENEGHGRVRLALRGDDARVLAPTLDAVASTMASESARQAPRRIDGARATLPTERATSGGVGYATLVAGPLGPETLTRMGIIAGSVFGAAMLLILVTYGMLSRSKRVFEASEGGEDADAMV